MTKSKKSLLKKYVSKIGSGEREKREEKRYNELMKKYKKRNK